MPGALRDQQGGRVRGGEEAVAGLQGEELMEDLGSGGEGPLQGFEGRMP